MANPFIFGGLSRAVNDNTTIDEAISIAVQSHDDDPDAHLDAEQSLTTHRAQEIIDHPVESVVYEIIRKSARRYVAIVDPDSVTDFNTIAEAVAYSRVAGGGDIFLSRGQHVLSGDLYLGPYCSLFGEGKGETIIVGDDATVRNIFLNDDYNAQQLQNDVK